MIGQTLDRYLIVSKIGEGGMGVVYRATDQRLHRDVALKILPEEFANDAQRMAQFEREARILASLNHPNIASIYGLEDAGGVRALVMELVEGASLAERVRAGALPEQEALALALQIAEALEAAHQKGVVHRDLKPANVKVTPEGRVKVLDFGLARPVTPVSDATLSDRPWEEETRTSVGVDPISGTLPYMAPEQLRGETVDARADIYALGASLYELVLGRRPFRETHVARLIESVLHSAPPPPSWLKPGFSPCLEELILKCLEKDPALRYQSARDLQADLRRAASAERRAKSVAVLYFENLGTPTGDTYFRDGITEDITTELAKIRGLHVFSRSAVLGFRDKSVTPHEVGGQLGASHVLEGSIRREAERLRITANLVETRSGHSVWAERYDRQLEDVFTIQDEIAHNIARALRVVLTDIERRAIEKMPTSDVQAYDFYLRGRQFFHQFRRKGLDFARQMFAQAIAIDPRYARAYAGIADCSAFLYMYWESTEANLEKADQASQKALEMDPDLAESHASRGFTTLLKKQYDEARAEFEIARRLNPALFEAYYFNARSYYAQGRLEEAVYWFEEASRVNPEDYQAPMLLASALHGLDRKGDAQEAYRRGLAGCEKHLELHPDDSRALYFGANALSQVGEKQRSVEWAGRAVAMDPEEPQVLYNVACVYALLGEAEKAIDCLQQSITHGWGQREWMEHDPDLASLRDHPRFQALLKS